LQAVADHSVFADVNDFERRMTGSRRV